ncbi:MAG: hypothetical protein JSW20_04895 [Nitrospiraceae bacterium]|nr:MAG: hypothetical protein JSW20_04895 [Nitrospiraceae bacterium]
METTLTNDYYLQFNETYFVARGNSKREDTKKKAIAVSNTKAGLLGRLICKGLCRTAGEILVVISLLVACKYTGLYDVWVQLIDRLV